MPTPILATPGFSARGILRAMQVAVVCTTDDPVDSLEHHIRLREEGFPVQVRPTWRPDRGMAIEDPQAFNAWLSRLEAASGRSITTWADYLEALRDRHRFFHAQGCRLSDHGLDTVYAEDCSAAQASLIFAEVRAGRPPTPEASVRFKSAMLHEWALMDHAAGWVQQFHIGAHRNANGRMFRQLGPDQGFDTIDDQSYGRPLARFLDRLDREDRLARTILYNLNPRDNELIATLAGTFQDPRIPGKIQFGSAWWFLDQRDGMERQLDALSNLGLLSEASSACSPIRAPSSPSPGMSTSAGSSAPSSVPRWPQASSPTSLSWSAAWCRTSATAMRPAFSISAWRAWPPRPCQHPRARTASDGLTSTLAGSCCGPHPSAIPSGPSVGLVRDPLRAGAWCHPPR